MTSIFPNLQHNLKQNAIDGTEKKDNTEDQLGIIQYLKNTFRILLSHLLKKILLEHRKLLTGIITKMDPQQIKLGKCTQNAFLPKQISKSINSIRFR